MDPVLMVKLLVLQAWYGLSDPELERQVNDRISFRHFLGYPEKAPDYSTVWQFRERLAKTGRDRLVWAELQRQLDEKGLKVKKGVVIEAKMFANLSRGTTNAPYYDQAARSVACIAWEISQSKRQVYDFESLGFYVIAPRKQIVDDVFSSQVNKSSIKEKVERRISAYAVDDKKYAELQTWQKDSFIPVLERIDLRCIPWETIIDKIDDPDIRNFYRRCILFNTSARTDG